MSIIIILFNLWSRKRFLFTFLEVYKLHKNIMFVGLMVKGFYSNVGKYINNN